MHYYSAALGQVVSEPQSEKSKCEQHAARLGCQLDFQIIGHRAKLDAIAPNGYCFEEGLHCLTETIFRHQLRKITEETLHCQMTDRLKLYSSLEKCEEGCDCENE